MKRSTLETVHISARRTNVEAVLIKRELRNVQRAQRSNHLFRKIFRRGVLSLATALIAFTSVSLQAQTKKPVIPGEKGKAKITLNLQDVDIRVLINTVAEVSGKNFVVDPRVKGKVSVISGASLDPDQLYDVFLSILEVHNFATVDSGSVIKVLPSNVIKQRPTPTEFEPTDRTNDTQITQIIQLQYAGVQELVPIVRPLIPPTSHFAPHVPSNSVVITDTAANIQRVLKIIKRIDVPDKRSSVHVVYLEKTKASELAATLTQIVASNADPKPAGSATKVSIQAFDSIGALVINATDDEFQTLNALIDQLDIERKLDANINVIYLKHAKAEDLVSVLNDLTKVNGAPAGSAVAPSLQADEATNALIVKASGSQLQTMRDVIEKLDVRREQVFVETIIAEVSLDQAANLGVTWGAGGPFGATAAVGETAATGGRGNIVSRDNRNQVLGTAAVNTAFELGTGGLNYSLLDFEKYQLDVVINALRADTNSNILSTPTILTLDNEEAEIIVGQEVPFVTGRFNNGQGNSVTNNADGSQSNSIGSSFQSIERKDVGIKLKIKPQISDGNTIQLEVLQEISSVAKTAVAGQADLITNRRSIQATVQVDDGQVIVLGGLIQDDVVDTVNRVPILGKIPIIGALFRSSSKTAVKRNLMVFLKPRIIRNADDLAKFSKIKYEEVRRDSKISRTQSSNFLIEDSAPPVLDEYENVIGDGVVSSERRSELSDEAKNGKKRYGLGALFQNKRTKEREAADSEDDDDSSDEFKTDGALQDVKEQGPIISEPIVWDRKVGDAESARKTADKLDDESINDQN
ncbi:MAG: general secretion pathway protein D [Polaribacter sp.]